MFDASTAKYGEEHALWDGRDAEGFTKLAGVHAKLALKARTDSVDAAAPQA
jgi:argininosuccinate synthase